MTEHPKMTKAMLSETWQRNHGNPDIYALLWEVHRLRSIVLRADQLQRALEPMGGTRGLMLDSLRHELAGEPCVEEFPDL